jgi:hypothetical protein
VKVIFIEMMGGQMMDFITNCFNGIGYIFVNIGFFMDMMINQYHMSAIIVIITVASMFTLFEMKLSNLADKWPFVVIMIGVIMILGLVGLGKSVS